MIFTKLCPNIFYSDIRVGIRLFVDCLQFKIGYDDRNAENPFCVIERDGLAAHLIQSREFAEKDRPELRLETPDIDEVYERVKSYFPDLLHPNGKVVTLKPWGAREFAIRDESGLCLIIQQWR